MQDYRKVRESGVRKCTWGRVTVLVVVDQDSCVSLSHFHMLHVKACRSHPQSHMRIFFTIFFLTSAFFVFSPFLNAWVSKFEKDVKREQVSMNNMRVSRRFRHSVFCLRNLSCGNKRPLCENGRPSSTGFFDKRPTKIIE